MSGKVEKSEKSTKLPRERSKGSKDKEGAPELNLESAKVDSDVGRNTSPRHGKKRKTESVLFSSSPVAGVRFEGADDKTSNREKINTRSSSAGPPGNSEVRPRAEPMEEADVLMTMFRDFMNQMASPLNNVVRKNQDLRSQVSLLLKASQADEAPYLALAREKESLSREYDQLRYEHQLLQQEFQSLRRENLDLVAITQQLQTELAVYKYSSSSPPISRPNLSEANSNLNVQAPVVAPSTPVFGLRRKDNVAELEQSILDLEEEIRSPRSGSNGSSGGYEVGAGAPTKETPTKKARKGVPKSHSNDPVQGAFIVQSSSSGSTNSTSSNRAKAPPERVVSAPSEVKSAISSPSASSSGQLTRQEAKLVANIALGSAAAGVGSPKPTPEDREEQRLLKYMQGNGRRSTPNLGSKSQLNLSRNSASPSNLTFTEQSAFAHIFRKWDSNDDDFIDRHQLELTFDAMSSHSDLKDLHTTTQPHFSKIPWSSLGITISTEVTLAAALTFLSDSKTGHPNPSVLINK
jgi:hypothetical protein